MSKYSKIGTQQTAVLDLSANDLEAVQLQANKVEHFFEELIDIKRLYSSDESINDCYSDFMHAMVNHTNFTEYQRSVFKTKALTKDFKFYDKYMDIFNIINALKNKVALIVDKKIDEKYNGVQEACFNTIWYGRAIWMFDGIEINTITPDKYWWDIDGLNYIENKDEDYYSVITVNVLTGKGFRTEYKLTNNVKEPLKIIGIDESLNFSTKFIEVPNYLLISDIEACFPYVIKIDITETIKQSDMYRTQTTIHADDRYFSRGRTHKSQGQYMIYNTAVGEQGAPLFNVSQPQLRFDLYNAEIDFNKQEIANVLGINSNALGIRLAANTLATVAVLEEETTMNNVNAIKKHFTTILSVIDPDLNFGEYVISSPTAISEIIQRLNGSISTEHKVKLSMPNATHEERLRETILLKIENGKMLTLEEEQFASANGLLGTEVETLNTYE